MFMPWVKFFTPVQTSGLDSVASAVSAVPAGVLFSVLLPVVVLLLAMAIDWRCGEPSTRFHPVAWMGNYLQGCGRVTVRQRPAAAYVLGALAWWVGALVIGALAWGLQRLAFEGAHAFILMLGGLASTGASSLSGLSIVIIFQQTATALLAVIALAGLLKCMLSWRMLHDEAGAVETALQQSLSAGRERLSWLVSRDTSALNESEVRESAIESLAENLNDSVVAPLFWFVLFGLPGAAVYRFANTADAMWGYPGIYRGNNWQWAGKWAARADDVLSWIPARLTAWLLVITAKNIPWQPLRIEARKTPSPNSGWPMSAMAIALGVSLRKPGVYTLNPTGRAPQSDDMEFARRYAMKAIFRLLLVAAVLIVLTAVLMAMHVDVVAGVGVGALPIGLVTLT